MSISTSNIKSIGLYQLDQGIQPARSGGTTCTSYQLDQGVQPAMMPDESL